MSENQMVYGGVVPSVRAMDIIEILSNVGIPVPVCDMPTDGENITVKNLKAWSMGLGIKQTTPSMAEDADDGFVRINHNHMPGVSLREIFDFCRGFNPYKVFGPGCGGNNPLVVLHHPEAIRQLGRAVAHFWYTQQYWSIMDQWDGMDIPVHHRMIRREGNGDIRQIHAWVDQNRTARVRFLVIGEGKWKWHPIQKNMWGKIRKPNIALTKFHYLASLLSLRDNQSQYTGIEVAGGRWERWFLEGLNSEAVILSGFAYEQLAKMQRFYGFLK